MSHSEFVGVASLECADWQCWATKVSGCMQNESQKLVAYQVIAKQRDADLGSFVPIVVQPFEISIEEEG